jgi:hypothetical protein
MTKEDIIILGAIAGGIAAVVSAVLNGVFTILNQWLIGRREERRHLLDLCFKAATDNLQRDTEAAKAKSQSTGERVGVGPIDLYLFHMISLVRLSSRRNISYKRLVDEWLKVKRQTKDTYETMEKETEPPKQRS